MLTRIEKYQPNDKGYYPKDIMPIERRPRDYVESAGKRLRQARLALGFSQKEFCQILDVKTGIYSAWENGNYLIDPFIATKISNDFKSIGANLVNSIYGGKKDNLPTKLRNYLYE